MIISTLEFFVLFFFPQTESVEHEIASRGPIIIDVVFPRVQLTLLSKQSHGDNADVFDGRLTVADLCLGLKPSQVLAAGHVLRAPPLSLLVYLTWHNALHALSTRQRVSELRNHPLGD